MDLPREEMERLIFFESAREKAAADYIRAPHDSDNLTRWGGALLELAHFRQGQDSIDMIQEAESKLEEALKIDPKKHETLWCLGNAHTAHGFLFTDPINANDYFKRATQCFQRALIEEPENDLYLKALEMSAKAPNVYAELQKQMISQQLAGLGGGAGAGAGAGAGSGSRINKKKKKKSSDLKYDLLGWVVLTLGIVAWVGMAKGPAPRPL